MNFPIFATGIILAMSQPSTAGSEKVLFDFTKKADVSEWSIEDDSVMGGVSRGRFRINEEGHGEFTGTISLENNGGFSSVQWNFDPVAVGSHKAFVVRVRGDGKKYRLLTEEQPGDRHYYQAEFEAGTDWQTIEIPFSKMEPHFRGDKLDKPNFPGKTATQVRFMVANNKAETFRLEIDKVFLR